MRLKAEYIAGVIEFEYGPDMKRAEYHFEEFLGLCKIFKQYALERQVPDINSMKHNADEYKQ